jgi:hypothetical protein
MTRQPSSELDEVQRRLRSVYRYCLYALVLMVTGFAVVLFRGFAHDANQGFLNIYGGVAYLTFLAWAVGKLRALRPGPPSRPGANANFTRDADTGAWELSVHVGGPEPDAGPGGSADPGTTDREARPLRPRAAAIVAWIVLASAALALLFALWTLR